MSEQTNVEAINRLYQAFRHGDIQAVLGCLDPRAELIFEGPSAIPWTGTRHGREGWATFFETIGETLEDVTLDMAPFAAQGDKVVAVGRYQAKLRGTGNRIDSPLVHLWTLDNGMITQCKEFTNTAAELAACGARAEAESALAAP